MSIGLSSYTTATLKVCAVQYSACYTTKENIPEWTTLALASHNK